ncbi:MAG TPA: hypothetical protein VGM88_06440 [Kofleriaceae bacterium]
MRALALLVVAACGQAKPAEPVAGSGSAVATAPVVVDAPRPDAAPPAPPHVMKHGDDTPAIRCTTDAGPLFANHDSMAMLHIQSDFSLAVTPAGDVYTSDNLTISRWKLEATPGACVLHLDPSYAVGGRLDLPAIHNRMLDSNIEGGYCTRPRAHHRATGDTCPWQWNLAAGPDGAVYMTDDVSGTYRIDRGSVEPTCPDSGFRQLQFAPNGHAIGDLSKGIDLATCATTRMPWEPKEQRDGPLTMLAGFLGDEPIIDRDGMYRDVGTTSIQYGHRYEETDRICQTAMAFACGDDLCFADSGCMRVSRFTRAGAFRGAWTLESHGDPEPRPDRMLASARMPNGDLLMVTVFRYWHDGTQSERDRFEVWPVLMPAAAFTP